ncbi:Dual specificity protein kinase KNS1 [Yarrowia sp. C11]|nr:Dual specificity protein kinase KNS1 [Yarrowia sp. E02]KAG5373198.1 Dual specificity protein kinase KNS1 [Yarrowia sp. C11]
MSTTIASPMSTPTTQDPGPANNPFRHLQTYSQLPRHMISPSLDKFSDSSSSYWGSRRSTGTKEPAGLVPEVPQNVVDDELQILGAQVLRDASPGDGDDEDNSSEHTTASTSGSSTGGSPSKKHPGPNWHDFYKNGYPDEVIVIDSDSEDDEDTTQVAQVAQVVASSSKTALNRRISSAADLPVKRRKFSQSSTSGSTTATHNSSSDQQLDTNTHTTLDQDSDRNVLLVDDENDTPLTPPPKLRRKIPEVYVRPVTDKTKLLASQYDDKDGHYVTTFSDVFTERYVIRKLLGQGTFGKVVSAYDKQTDTLCAIKIIRAVPKYRDASKIELRVLTALADYDAHNKNRCIHLRECFDFRNHVCIVTDLLDISVFDFMRDNRFQPFPGSHIQKLAKQLIKSVAFLHGLGLIHTDLKPENILLKKAGFVRVANKNLGPSSIRKHNYYRAHDPKKTEPKTRNVLKDTCIHLIDFGSAIFDDEYHSSVVSTRHYRAPEIILGVGWSYPCDMWSIGCILVELFTGDALFHTHEDFEHLALMEAIIGYPFPKAFVKEMISKKPSAQVGNFFNARSGKLGYPNKDTTTSSRHYIRDTQCLTDLIHTSKRSATSICDGANPDWQFWDQFLDLVRKMLVFDPRERITAREALQHDWFKCVISDEGSV